MAYFLWGLLPIYWKTLKSVPAFEILLHRVLWSAVFVSIIVFFRGNFRKLRDRIREPKTLLTFFLTSLIIGGNWLTYIWAVNAGFVLESSLGYFLNPLISVLLGILFLKENLNRLQKLAILFATIGVGIQILVGAKSLWISLTLALSFGVYGLLRKTAKLESLDGLFLETLLLTSPALAYLIGIELKGSGHFLTSDFNTRLLLIGAGPATAVPLLFFAKGARMVSMTTLGVLQYIAPTLQFFLAVYVYKETFTSQHLLSFGCIWIGIVIYSIDGARSKASK
ncbi:MAG: EamA family transporter RarD [Bdellovibrionales bacterium]|nr:EamA family transporter RarD [Bdellovibrionales bacterium]